MVAVIKSSGSLSNVLHYNENKVKHKVAEYIHASGFAKDTEKLSLHDIKETIEKRQQLNQRTQLSTVHISLNFDAKDSLDTQKLRAVADSYMQQIGFGSQPYLVYQHHDAGHPHIHIVSTNIKPDGKRISMQNIGRNQSEIARKQIEIAFGLIRAQKEKPAIKEELITVRLQKIQYGKVETKRAITNVLVHVLTKYAYGSLPELNAVLKLYNLVADRGAVDSRTYTSNGLVYRVLDDKGEKIGVPIKASLIYNNPGLAFLEEQFHKNLSLKQSRLKATRSKIDTILMTKKIDGIAAMETELKTAGIDMVQRLSADGRMYGITYVDHQQKAVFNGSELGKAFSALAIQKRFEQFPVKESLRNVSATVDEAANNNIPSLHAGSFYKVETTVQREMQNTVVRIVDQLTAQGQEGSINGELLKEKKRKKGKRQQH